MNTIPESNNDKTKTLYLNTNTSSFNSGAYNLVWYSVKSLDQNHLGTYGTSKIFTLWKH